MSLSLYSTTFTDHFGNPLANQRVYFFDRGRIYRPATVYTTNMGTTPMTAPATNGSGQFSGYLYAGFYAIKVGVRTYTATINPLPFNDNDSVRVVKLLTEDLAGTTLVDDSELFYAVEANATYAFRAFIHAYAEAATDFRVSFTGPAGSTVTWATQSVSDTAALGIGPINVLPTAGGAAVRVGASGIGTTMTPEGTIVTAGTAGLLRFQIALWNAPAEDPQIYAGSWLKVERLR